MFLGEESGRWGQVYNFESWAAVAPGGRGKLGVMSNRAFHRPVVGAALILLSTCLAPSGYSSAPKETPPPAPAPTPAAEVVYRTFNYPQRWNTTGALFFDSREAVKACFDRVYSGRSQGFRPCEPKALAVVPPGLALKLLEKWLSLIHI